MWLSQSVLHTYLKSKLFISCLQAEAVACVASRGEPVPGREIRDGFPALQGANWVPSRTADPTDSKVEKPEVFSGVLGLLDLGSSLRCTIPASLYYPGFFKKFLFHNTGGPPEGPVLFSSQSTEILSETH